MASLVPAIIIGSVCHSSMCNQVQFYLPQEPSVDLAVSIPVPLSSQVVDLLARRTVHSGLTQPLFQGCVAGDGESDCTRARVTPVMEEDAIMTWPGPAGQPITLTVRASTKTP